MRPHKPNPKPIYCIQKVYELVKRFDNIRKSATIEGNVLLGLQKNLIKGKWLLFKKRAFTHTVTHLTAGSIVLETDRLLL